jgi:hypothetical protein
MITNFLNKSIPLTLNFFNQKFFIHSTKLLKSLNNVTVNSVIDTTDENFKKVIIIKKKFINEMEENLILEENEFYMKRLRYECDHWDDVNIVSN